MAKAGKGKKSGGGDLFELDEIDALLARMGVPVPDGAPPPVAAPAGEDEGEDGPSALLDAAVVDRAPPPARPEARRGGLAIEALSHGRAPVGQLLPEGAVVHVGLDKPWARAGAEIGLGAAATALDGWIGLHKEAGDALTVTGGLRVARAHRCDRCLRPLELALEGPIDLRYLPESEVAPELSDEHGLAPAELDLGWYAGGVLELETVVCEQIALWMPDRVVCGDPGVRREGADDGPCALPGPAGELPGPKPSPFAVLAGWRPSR